MGNLYDWFLHYNHYTGYWNALKRDKSNQYLNGKLDDNDVLKNKDVNVLIKYITTLK